MLFKVICGVEDLTIDHNTCLQQNGKNVIMLSSDPSPRLTFTNNIAPHGSLGVVGDGKGIGAPSLSYYSPGYVFRKNVLAGGIASKYPPGNFFPANLDGVKFVDLGSDDYHLAPDSPYRNAGTDGLDIGAAIDDVLSATSGVNQEGHPPAQVPLADSVTPSSGSGLSQLFRLVYSDGNGFADIAEAGASIDTSQSPVNGCWLRVRPTENAVWLRTDDGSAWLGPLALGAMGGLSNNQCAVHGASSSVAGSASSLTVNLSLTFSPTFKGLKNIYMYASDGGGLNSGWRKRGTWTVPNLAPTSDLVTPASGGGSSRTFQFVYSDPNGASDIAYGNALFNTSTSQTRACYVQYKPAERAIRLRNNLGTGWLGPLTIGSSSTLRNSQCTVKAAGSTASTFKNSLTLGLAVTFAQAFAGAKNTYLYVTDKGGKNSGWQKHGTWTVPQ